MPKNSATLTRRTGSKPKIKKTPTQLLREDHKTVKGLPGSFEKSKNPNRQKEIFETVAKELKVHMTVEEELFYPVARSATGDDELLDEAREEHHVADVLIVKLSN